MLLWGRKIVRITWKLGLLLSPVLWCHHVCCTICFLCICVLPDSVQRWVLLVSVLVPLLLFSSGDLLQRAGAFDPSRWDYSSSDLPSGSHQCPVQILGWLDCCWCPISAVPLWGKNRSQLPDLESSTPADGCGCCCSSDCIFLLSDSWKKIHSEVLGLFNLLILGAVAELILHGFLAFLLYSAESLSSPLPLEGGGCLFCLFVYYSFVCLFCFDFIKVSRDFFSGQVGTGALPSST